ncbi:AAA family ATPase [Campylobacter insulaenigrae]|uniref:RecD-like DNA helicase (AAA domain) n=1 Tax=Campylobacter insulaenigrae NCTC 12927 TaxID=1031564 RepID=A0A0A8H2I7_9BACT|nr:AAA family ATPase [Campylobacter insulaenigrae]AJC88192.1 RecD-like DNA helicase (AAA domain) [Campylobacter insulaenigrae NCTC 12927]VEH95217.1 helicase [Campylobacter insulaenigrae]
MEDKSVLEQIIVVSQNFNKNIKKHEDDRGFLSQNILNELRNLIEHIALYIYNRDTNNNFNSHYDNLKVGIVYISDKAKYVNIRKMHNFLQITSSHYTPDEETSERLMLKYISLLIKIKQFCKNNLNIDILQNIYEFPIKLDNLSLQYYERVTNVINNTSVFENTRIDKFYIHKVKPFIVDKKMYYEITFVLAKNNTSKFDKIIAFSKEYIPDNYAVELKLYDTSIWLNSFKIPIILIINWNVSIRPCELKNFCVIFGLVNINFIRNAKYERIMQFLKYNELSLLDIIKLNDIEYQNIKNEFSENKFNDFFKCLDKARDIITNNKKGKNILSYLLNSMNNVVVKHQKGDFANEKLSNLCLKNSSIPFEDMPFCTSLAGHNPRLIDLYECLDAKDRGHELLARTIKNNSKIHGNLYKDIEDFVQISKENILELVRKYNDSIEYEYHKPKRHIEILYEKYLYINEDEVTIKNIILKLKNFTQSGIENYQKDIKEWLENNNLDCAEKKNFLEKMFCDSKLALIYGAAGTGKTTLIEYISNFFKDKNILFLTNTYTALDNIKRRIKNPLWSFNVISSCIKKRKEQVYDIVIIDECSTIDNKNIFEFLNKVKCDVLVCVGDVYQIEAINFGNWFLFAQNFFKDKQIELKHIYRTNDESLQDLWKEVRELGENILEKLSKKKISEKIENFNFNAQKEDEIILCLNYGGLYGVNNINRLLQENNPKQGIQFNSLYYKIDDPILFNNESSLRFGQVIHNNLKGSIVDIKKENGYALFVVNVYKNISKESENSFKVTKKFNNEYTEIAFKVDEINSDEEDEKEHAVPFQVAYAISIHKAQGLEYDNVSIIISDEIEEQITHNIFYTAITRAKIKLKIYWSAETENKVLNSLKLKDIKQDYNLLLSKLK